MLERVTDKPVAAANAESHSCFHCGLPFVEAQAPAPMQVLGEARNFCCHGCRAVCKAITDAGLEAYYRYRSEPAVAASRQAVPDFLKQAELYDRPDIQKDFVSGDGEWREAALLLENIRCPACLWLNEKQLRNLPGVLDVHIDDVTQRARVRWDPARIKLSGILEAISRIGYLAHPYDATRSEQLDRVRKRRSTEKLIFAGAAGMFVMNFSLATYVMGPAELSGQLPLWEVVGRWTSLLICSAILGYSAQDFFAGAWSDIRNRRPGMDIPIVLGLAVAWFGSLHATVSGQGEVYFDSIAMFVFFVLLARRLELAGKLKAANRLDRLTRVIPRTAKRCDSSGVYSEVAVDDLVVGDRVRLLPGETLAVDAVLVNGVSSFDESLLTGEAYPVVHRPGDALAAGSVNGDQPVTVEVKQTLQTSTLNQIRQLVERGLEQRPHYAQVAEQVARWFVVTILLIALLTAGYWYLQDPANWLPSTIAVLIVTCPCALALATPVALSVSVGRFLEMGVLPLRMRALDTLAKADLFAFDKTGTLTRGRPVLSDIVPTGDIDRSEILRIAVALSAASEHPVARALRATRPPPYAVAEAVENLPGEGVRGLIAGRAWRLGKPANNSADTVTDVAVAALVNASRAQGKIVSVLSSPDGVQAVLSFDDPLRLGMSGSLRDLKRSGVKRFSILSGDAGQSVRRTADATGIADCHSDMSPTDKLAWVHARQEEGHCVLMFGDGINDAPTLAAADVSVSFADATDLANSSSDFLVLGENGEMLARARRLAQRTQRKVRQNLAWAAAYNLLAVPFAAAGLVPPWGAAIGMSLSSLVVVTNALRLK